MNPSILLYHEVTDFPERAKKIREIDPSYSLPTKQFEEQMAWISRGQNTKVVTADGLFCETQDNSKKIALTFDDGLIGNYLYAFNILEKYGFKATFFVTVRFISKLVRFMNWEQIADLHQNGHLIQSHTMTHPMLGVCDERQITYELETSKKTIEDKLGAPVRYLSLPFGSFDERVVKIAKATGYQAIFTSSRRMKDSNGELHQFGRVHVKDTYSLEKFVRLIDPNPTQVFLTTTKEALKGFIKEMIGLDNYRKLYRFIYRIEL